MTNSRKIKGLIIEKGMTQKDIASRIGLSRTAFNYKINNKHEFTVSEIMSLCDILDIKDKNVYFFCRQVDKMSTKNP